MWTNIAFTLRGFPSSFLPTHLIGILGRTSHPLCNRIPVQGSVPASAVYGSLVCFDMQHHHLSNNGMLVVPTLSPSQVLCLESCLKLHNACGVHLRKRNLLGCNTYTVRTVVVWSGINTAASVVAACL